MTFNDFWHISEMPGVMIGNDMWNLKASLALRTVARSARYERGRALPPLCVPLWALACGYGMVPHSVRCRFATMYRPTGGCRQWRFSRTLTGAMFLLHLPRAVLLTSLTRGYEWSRPAGDLPPRCGFVAPLRALYERLTFRRLRAAPGAYLRLRHGSALRAVSLRDNVVPINN